MLLRAVSAPQSSSSYILRTAQASILVTTSSKSNFRMLLHYDADTLASYFETKRCVHFCDANHLLLNVKKKWGAWLKLIFLWQNVMTKDLLLPQKKCLIKGTNTQIIQNKSYINNIHLPILTRHPTTLHLQKKETTLQHPSTNLGLTTPLSWRFLDFGCFPLKRFLKWFCIAKPSMFSKPHVHKGEIHALKFIFKPCDSILQK